MADGERHSVTPVQFGVVLGLFMAASWWNGTTSSFHPVYAPLKLSIGLLHLVAIGFACTKLLGLQRPQALAPAHDALLGQVVCLAYVYTRSIASNLLGLPGISPAETFLAEAILLAAAFRRSRPQKIRLSCSPRNAAWTLALHFLWLGWLFAVALQKLDLFYTPSSDPDIHAYYAKIFLERGRIYYDLLPGSDAWMVYPSGFSSLNFVLGRLSGLHAVQLVNVAAYLQLALFAGAGFAVLASLSARRSTAIPLALFHFGFIFLGFNAVFGEHRMFLEGTPRLAHTALLFFPLFFALQHHRSLSARSWLWGLPLVAVLVGMCLNPTHAPAAVLVGALSLGVTRFAGRQAPGTTTHRPWVRVLEIAVAVATTAIFLSSDPFYRSLAAQQSAPSTEREQATDLTGAAFTMDVDPGALISQALPSAAREIIASPDGSAAQRHVREFLLAAVLLGLAIGLAKRRLGQQGVPSEFERLWVYAGAALGTLLIHAVWSEIAQQLGRPGVLQTRLLAQYTSSLQQQINLMFFGLAPAVLLALFLVSFDRRRGFRPPRMRNRKFAVAVGLALLSVPFLATTHREHHSKFYSQLRNSPLGRVYASDADFAQRVQAQVGHDERVLLPGRPRRMPGEHWVFTTEASRAIPLFSNARTSFFLGLDGWAYTAGAYEAHVDPPNFDPQWLRAERLVWLVESGNFPMQILKRHYERVFGNDHAVLWRLREREERLIPAQPLAP